MTQFSGKKLLSFLRDTEMFRELSEEVLEKLSHHFETVYLESGQTLIQSGEIGDSLYLVANGRLRIFNAKHEMMGEVGRGQLIGEVALLVHERRISTVIAIRDTALLKLSKEVFDEFIKNNPQQVLPIIRSTISRILSSEKAVTNTVATIVIAPAGNNQTHGEFARRFAEELSRYAPTVHLNRKKAVAHLKEVYGAEYDNLLVADKNETLINWLGEQEAKHHFVVYETQQEDSHWSRRCLRQADKILIVGNSEEDESLNSIETNIFSQKETLRKTTDLVLLHKYSNPSNTTRWLRLRPVESHHHLKKESKEDLQRLIRIITGNGIALVLGGGGARGFAHIGVYKAMRELGIPIDLIGGTSFGAMVSSFFAMNDSPEIIVEKFNTYLVHNKKLFDYTLPVLSLISGAGWTNGLKDAYGENFYMEDLWKRFFCIASNLTEERAEVIQTGLLWKAIRASISLPAIVPPVSNDENELLIDGAVINNLPVDIMQRFAAGSKIIAVRVPTSGKLKVHMPEGGLSGWHILKQFIWRKGLPDVPNIAEIIFKSIALCSDQHEKLMAAQADYYLEIDVKEIGLFDFKAIDKLVDRGYRAAMEKFSQISWNIIK